jgi:hypothetical protein
LSYSHCTYDDIGRLYHFDDDIKYYSVTTILDNTKDKGFLVRWRKRIGDVEADRQLEIAKRMGTEFHSLGEALLTGQDLTVIPTLPFPRKLFMNLVPRLRKITKIHSVEQVLRSDSIKCAGRADAVVDWENELAILDYKLVNFWNPEYIYDYWVQCSIYAVMYFEMTGNLPQLLVLAMGNKKMAITKTVTMPLVKFQTQGAYRIKRFYDQIADIEQVPRLVA